MFNVAVKVGGAAPITMPFDVAPRVGDLVQVPGVTVKYQPVTKAAHVHTPSGYIYEIQV